MEFGALPTILLVLLNILCFAAVVQGAVMALRHLRHPNYTSVLYTLVLGILFWLMGLLVLSRRGYFTDWEAMPWRMGWVLSVPIGLVLVLTVIPYTAHWLQALPPQRLLQLQFLRVPLEVSFWLLAKEGNCPQQMTFLGLNFDILVSALAPIATYAAFGAGRRLKWLAINYNILGLASLGLTVVLAMMSLPGIGALKPESRLLAYWPLAWWPGFLLPFFLLLHCLSLRQLVKGRQS